MERLSAEDAGFLRYEDQVSAMHGMTLAVFEGPEPRFDELLERMRRRVSLVPRLRQRVVEVPGDVQRPVWVDDPHFSLDYHMRHTGVPRRGGMDDVRAVAGRILSQRLDRGKPLWEMWMLDGLPKRQWAVLSKAHHSIIDAVSGSDPLTLVVDGVGDGPDAVDDWDPRAIPGEAELVAQGLLELAVDPVQQARMARRAVLGPARRTWRMVRPEVPAGTNDLVGAVGSFRQWATTEVEREAVRLARDRLDVTTNDVVLGLVTAGFRAMLEDGSAPIPATIRTVVPLAVATGVAFTNEISSLTADLPVARTDLDGMIRSIALQTERLGLDHRAVEGRTLADLPGLSAPTLATLGLRSAHRTARLASTTTVTVNVPGPSQEITLLDRPMIGLYPAIPLVGKVRISVGVMSYLDRLFIGVTGDSDAALEVGALVAGIERAAADLT